MKYSESGMDRQMRSKTSGRFDPEDGGADSGCQLCRWRWLSDDAGNQAQIESPSYIRSVSLSFAIFSIMSKHEVTRRVHMSRIRSNATIFESGRLRSHDDSSSRKARRSFTPFSVA